MKGKDSHVSKFSFTQLNISGILVKNKSKTQKLKVSKTFGQIFIYFRSAVLILFKQEVSKMFHLEKGTPLHCW